MKGINAGCHEAVGAFAQLQEDGSLNMEVMKDYDGQMFVHRAEDAQGNAAALAERLARRILEDAPGSCCGQEEQ